MKQRTALTLAAALTAFVLVVVGGLIARISQAGDSATAAAPTAEPATAAPAVAQLDPATEALIKQREAAYRQALDEANARLQQANAQIAEANQRLEQPVVVQAPTAEPTARPSAPASGAAIQPAQQPAAPTYAVNADQAQAIAKDAAAGADVTRAAELVSFQGVPAYEVGFGSALIYVDAQSGVVLYNGVAALASAAPAVSGQISQDQAAQAALAYLGGGTVSGAELREVRGVQVYIVTLADGSQVYVDPATGQVVYAEIVSNGGGEREGGEHHGGDDDGGDHDD